MPGQTAHEAAYKKIEIGSGELELPIVEVEGVSWLKVNVDQCWDVLQTGSPILIDDKALGHMYTLQRPEKQLATNDESDHHIDVLHVPEVANQAEPPIARAHTITLQLLSQLMRHMPIVDALISQTHNRHYQLGTIRHDGKTELRAAFEQIFGKTHPDLKNIPHKRQRLQPPRSE